MQRGDRRDHRRSAATRLPVSKLPDDGTFPTGTTQYEKRNIAVEIPVWDAGRLHPVRRVLPGLPARGHPPQGLRPGAPGKSAPPTFKSARRQGQGVRRHEVHRPGRPRGLHRLRRSACNTCPAEEKKDGRRPAARPSTWRPRSRCASRRRRTGTFFLALPDVDAEALQPRHDQGQPAHAAPVRVLRRLRRLRRDPLRQAADPALRRPRGHRQRHRLLLDLRRQPAHHALHQPRRRPRPGLVQLPVRGRRRVRHRHAPDRGQAARVRPGAAGRGAGREARGPRPGRDLLEADQSSQAGIEAQRARVAELKDGAAASRRREEARQLLSVADYLVQQVRLGLRRRRLGLRHRLRRPGPRDRLRPERQHPGPGHRGLLQHRRPDVQVHARWAPSPSSPPAASPWPGRTWA